MNQNNRKTAKTKVEKDFYKLLNISNFGNDCQNNIGNCKLELMFDGFEEIAYIKRYSNIFTDPKFTEFFQQIFFENKWNENFQKKTKKSITKTMDFMIFLSKNWSKKGQKTLNQLLPLRIRKESKHMLILKS